MTSYINSQFKKSYKALPKEIKQIAKKQYHIFKNDPYHASLHFKKIHSNKPIYSCRINKDYRTVGVLNNNVIIWFWIGSHGDYDKLLKMK